VAARRADIAAVQPDDEDPFGWDTPIAYHDQDARSATGEYQSVSESDPFAALRNVAPYQPDAALADQPHSPPAPEAIAAAADSTRHELVDVPSIGEARLDDARENAPATVYEPDDAAAWAATAAASPASLRTEDAGRRAAMMLAELADDVRRGRLRVDADANASPAGVLASLLASLLAPPRSE
jgi:hypothetical protein